MSAGAALQTPLGEIIALPRVGGEGEKEREAKRRWENGTEGKERGKEEKGREENKGEVQGKKADGKGRQGADTQILTCIDAYAVEPRIRRSLNKLPLNKLYLFALMIIQLMRFSFAGRGRPNHQWRSADSVRINIIVSAILMFS